MELKIGYLNPEVLDNTEEVETCNWYSRWKTYVRFYGRRYD